MKQSSPILLFIVIGFFILIPAQVYPYTGNQEIEEANNLLKARKDRQALAIFQEILKIQPDNLEARWGKAEVLRRERDYQEAENLLKTILKENPRQPSSLISLAYIRYKADKLNEALKLVNRALENCRSDSENKALCFMMLGTINSRRSEKGGFFSKIRYGTHIRGYFLKAKALAPQLPEVHLGLGTFYLLAPKIAGGNLNNAIAELELTVKLAPDFATANARLAQAYQKNGLEEKYEFYLNRAKTLDPDNEALKESNQNRLLYNDNRIMLGTFVEVTSNSPRAAQIVFNEIQRIENLFSKYKAESEISRLNQAGKLKVSPDTCYILKKAKEFSLASNGAFDITVGPLIDAWGFSNKQYTVPTRQVIQDTLKKVGSDKIILNSGDCMVKFGLSGMKIDLGAIAKGYAVDCAVKKLKENKITSCLINAGGQIYALGDKSGKPWRVAIKNPRQSGVSGYLEIKDKAVATSGDYEQYFFKDKKRYSHILNPKTGHPAESGIISVTVLAKDGLTADALSTAIFVLGREKGEALAKQFPETEIKIIEESNVPHH